MGKIKIHEIAKELDLTSKEIIEKANNLGIKVSSHLSSVDEEQANKIKAGFKNQNDKTTKSSSSNKATNNKKGKDEKKNETPVIIRREVIVTEENKKTEAKPKTNQADIGFVERNKNKDYNIVYRNKTTKPMTFSELFGIKDNKKETKEKKEENKVETTNKEEIKVNTEVKNNTTTEVNETKTQKDANYEKTVIANQNEEVKNVAKQQADQIIRNAQLEAKTITFEAKAEADKYAKEKKVEIKHSKASLTPYYNYVEDGISHVVHFDDACSYNEKQSLYRPRGRQ